MAGRRRRQREQQRPAPLARAVESAWPPEPAGAWLRGAPLALMAAAVGALALGLYLFTLGPTVALIDSGELTLAARDLGVAHPPGTPLWVLLAHPFARLPWGSVAQRVNASSAVFGALTCALAVLAWAQARRGTASQAGPYAPGRVLDLVPPAVAGLLLATSRTLWSYATVAEVYALNSTLLLATLALALRARRAGAGEAGWLRAAAVAFGLALGVHHATVVLALPGLLLLVLQARPELRSPRRLAGPALLAVAAAGCVYAQLPISAWRRPLVNWGDPSNWQRFLWHVSGRQYQAFFNPSAASIGEELRVLGRLLASEFGPSWAPLALALAALGTLALWRRDRGLLAGLLAIAALDLGYGVSYTIAEDKAAYYLPALIVIALLAGFGAERCLRAAGGRASACAVLLVALPLLGLWNAWPQNDRRSYRVADDLVSDTLQALRPAGLLMTCEWQIYSPWLYFREAEGRRPDALVIDVSLLRRSWYYATLRRQAPELLRRAEATLAPFLEELHAWEQDPRHYERDRTANERINERYQEMVLGLLAAHQGPVYATSDVLLPDATPDPGLARRLLARYAPTPQGLVFELGDPPGPPLVAPAPPDRGLFDERRFAPDDVVTLKLRPLYLSMTANRGRYFEARGQLAEAAAAYRRALQWDPLNGPALSGLGRVEAARGR